MKGVRNYKAKARIAPPNTANPPRATLATAALELVTVAGAVPVAELVLEGFRVAEVESVVFEVATAGDPVPAAVTEEVVLSTTATTTLVVNDAEVLVGSADEETEVLVYALLVEICTVLVDAAETREETEVEEEPAAVTTAEEEETEALVMVNGNDHWKMVGSESQEIWIPYTANISMSDGIDHVYSLAEFWTPAREY